MSMIDTMTDEQVSNLQKRALAVQVAEIYNAERQVLNLKLLSLGIKLTAEEVRTSAKALLALGPVNHPYQTEEAPDVEPLDG
mgnify:CR=1 FL=1